VSKGPVVVVLAAGKGSRFEGASHKLVQPMGGSTVLGCTLANVLESGLPMVVVTTAALADEAARAVASRDVLVLDDARAARGVAHSIAAGVTARADAPGWLVLPADMPLIKASTLRAVADALPGHAVVFAQHQGRRGHPVGFSSELFSELLALEGDEGARRLVARYPSRAVQVADTGILVDIDTEGDLAAARAGQITSP
jgi:molybdenum cofactor cytidylyltransferase